MMSTPVSLPLQATLPPLGTAVLPSSISQQTLSFHPQNQAQHQANPSSPLSNSTTKILRLSNFSPELKTRDIQTFFEEWEDEKGGFKIKWHDDVSCWIVFANPTIAKRAYLCLLSSPPEALQPSEGRVPLLRPYVGADVTQILTSVQNRPRSRINASMANGHARKGSKAGSGGGAALGHGRKSSFGSGPGHAHRPSRGSLGQTQLQEMINVNAVDDAAAPPVPAVPEQFSGKPSDETPSS